MIKKNLIGLILKKGLIEYLICKKNESKILVDAEEYEVQNAIDELVLKMMKKYNRERSIYIMFNYTVDE